jgi:hypothetical protein
MLDILLYRCVVIRSTKAPILVELRGFNLTDTEARRLKNLTAHPAVRTLR